MSGKEPSGSEESPTSGNSRKDDVKPGKDRDPVRVARIYGNASMSWLIIASLLVIYGGYLLSGNDATNSSVFAAVALAGAGGGALGAAFALAQFLAANQFRSAWTIYFLIRPILGALIALLVYITLRGVYLSDAAGPQELNLYGVLGIALLCGLFSRQILSRLSHLSIALFSEMEPKRRAPMSPAGLEIGRDEVDRYKGYLNWSLKHQSGTTWLLTIQASPHPLPQHDNTSLEFGAGMQPKSVRLDLLVLSHDAAEVSPIRTHIAALENAESTEASFVFRGTELAPRALIEVSQRGRTVRALKIQAATDET